jgi:hypothetical protein
VSLILDALNRSRGDAESVPGLATEHTVPGEPRNLHKYLPWAALALALVVIAWLLVDRDDVAETPFVAAELSQNVNSALTSVKEELKARAVQQEAARASQSPEPGPLTATATPPLQPVPARQPSAAERPAGGEPPAAKEPQAVADPAAQEIEQLYAQSTPEEPAPSPEPAPREQSEAKPAVAVSEEPVDIEQILLEARNELENSRLVEHPAPFLVELSQRTKDEIPTILYQQHDYSDSRGGSTVVLNGKTLRAGGSAGAGLTVDEILPGSVILSYRGTQFRLRALNSWVNL